MDCDKVRWAVAGYLNPKEWLGKWMYHKDRDCLRVIPSQISQGTGYVTLKFPIFGGDPQDPVLFHDFTKLSLNFISTLTREADLDRSGR